MKARKSIRFKSDHPDVQPAEHDVEIHVVALRSAVPEMSYGRIKVVFDDPSLGKTCINVTMTLEQFREFAKDVQDRRDWLGA